MYLLSPTSLCAINTIEGKERLFIYLFIYLCSITVSLESKLSVQSSSPAKGKDSGKSKLDNFLVIAFQCNLTKRSLKTLY